MPCNHSLPKSLRNLLRLVNKLPLSQHRAEYHLHIVAPPLRSFLSTCLGTDSLNTSEPQAASGISCYYQARKPLENSCCCVATQAHPTVLRPHGLEPTRILCSWDFPGKNSGVGCHFLLQGNLPSPGMYVPRFFVSSQQGFGVMDIKAPSACHSSQVLDRPCYSSQVSNGPCYSS